MGASGTSKDPLDQLEEVLTFEQARPRAAGVVNPEYNRMMQQTLDSLRRQQMARGMYGQLPADVFTQRQAADIDAARAQAIIDYANRLVEQSKASALQKRGLDLQQQGLDLQASYQMGMLANQAAELNMRRQQWEDQMLWALYERRDIPYSTMYERFGKRLGIPEEHPYGWSMSSISAEVPKVIDVLSSSTIQSNPFGYSGTQINIPSMDFSPQQGFVPSMRQTNIPAGTAGLRPYQPL
ncbi:MAG TPA: hypothetical protein PLY10_11075 [Bacillota bacterium]|nr:hypothetical protein [Bacillota bacterium]HPZ55587.1 hypothetical protein [Bacillota bacterium]